MNCTTCHKRNRCAELCPSMRVAVGGSVPADYVHAAFVQQTQFPDPHKSKKRIIAELVMLDNFKQKDVAKQMNVSPAYVCQVIGEAKKTGIDNL